jgi:hypothetical protein
MKCKDCGTPEFEPSSRSDVCKNCFQLRLEFIRARKAGEISAEQFAAVQRTMSTDVFHEGRAAKKMKKILNVTDNRGDF